MNTDQFAKEAADTIFPIRGSIKWNHAYTIIKTAIEKAVAQKDELHAAALQVFERHHQAAIEKATEILQNQLAATQVELDGADKVIANYERAARASEQEKWTVEYVDRLLGITIANGIRRIADSHNATLQPKTCDQCSRKLEDGALYEDHSPQSDDTKRLDWVLKHGVNRLGLTTRETIDEAMSQTKEKE